MAPNEGRDPPETLEAATQRFSDFLVRGAWPAQICWLTRDDLLVVSPNYHFLVRPRRSAGLEEAEANYAIGLERRLGIALEAMCASEEETFAHVVVPEDDLDRQSRLMSKGLKLSHPIGRRKVTVVLSGWRWNILASRYAEQSKMIWC